MLLGCACGDLYGFFESGEVQVVVDGVPSGLSMDEVLLFGYLYHSSNGQKFGSNVCMYGIQIFASGFLWKKASILDNHPHCVLFLFMLFLNPHSPFGMSNPKK